MAKRWVKSQNLRRGVRRFPGCWRWFSRVRRPASESSLAERYAVLIILDVAAQNDHGEPQDQRTRRDELGGERRIFTGSQVLDSAENASQIERRRIHSKQQDSEQLDPESVVQRVELRHAYERQQTSHDVGCESRERPR